MTDYKNKKNKKIKEKKIEILLLHQLSFKLNIT